MPQDLQALLAEQHERYLAEGEALSTAEIVERISVLCHNLSHFWSKAGGWAPADAATLLNSARLDRIASLADSLRHWTNASELSDGDLILAWTNLGSVMEGALKLFLCVYLEDYRSDDEMRKTKAFDAKKQIIKDPDGLILDIILHSVDGVGLLPEIQVELGRNIQGRRNAIHAFKSRNIGTTNDFYAAVRSFRAMLLSLHARLPYPDSQFSFGELTRLS